VLSTAANQRKCQIYNEKQKVSAFADGFERRAAGRVSCYLFIMKFVQLGTQIKHYVKKENIQKYTKSTL